MWKQLSGKATHRAGFLTTPNPIYPPKIPSNPPKNAPKIPPKYKKIIFQLWDFIEAWDFHKAPKPINPIVLTTHNTLDHPKIPWNLTKTPQKAPPPQPPKILKIKFLSSGSL